MISRRNLLLSLPAIASRALAQAKPTLPVVSLSHMTLTVSDRKRSVEFYQGLFGLPVQHRQGRTIGLRIGSGLQYVAMGEDARNPKPAIAHLCMTVERFNVDRIQGILAQHGVTKTDEAGRGPMRTWVRMRGEDAGRAKEGTPELYLGDPDGIEIQLQDTTYCGGAGTLGNLCKPPEPAPSKGLIALRGLNHFTLSVSDAPRSNKFYQEIFGMSVRAYQGPTAPALAVGTGRQFLMAAGGGGRGGAMPNIGHACVTMAGFHPDQVLKTLADFGIKPRGDAAGPPKPLVSYVTMRMENRGGAEGGTPELYFTDPDGILMQIQDVSYCGGSGFLGDACP